MEITVDVDLENNEGTDSPWWIIIDPKQNFHTSSEGLYNIAYMITGPFFSRKKAQAHLTARRYAFSKNAKVYCHSGYWSNEYKNACRDAEKLKRKEEMREDIKGRYSCCD